MIIKEDDYSINKNILITFKGLPGLNEENIKNDFKIHFIENYVKLNKDQKSADQVVSDLAKSTLRKAMKNTIQKKPEIEVHLIRS